MDTIPRDFRYALQPGSAEAGSLTVAYVALPMQRDGRLQNVGDDVIRLGVRNLMQCAIGPHRERRVDFGTPGAEFPADADVLVVCGTPQVTDGSVPFRRLQQALAAAEARVPVRLNIGAGSYYLKAFDPDVAAADAAFAARVKAGRLARAYAGFQGFHLVTTRDMAAAQALRGVGVAALPMPCPGFFAPLFQPRPLLRHPALLVSALNGRAGLLHTKAFDLHGFLERLHASRPEARFIAHDAEDAEMLTDLSIPHCTFGTAEALVDYLAAHESIFALRVHGALPSWSLGLDVTLLGLDRRARIGEDFGASFRVLPLRDADNAHLAAGIGPAARPVQDDAARSAWLQRHLDLYVRNIRAAVETVLGPLPPVRDMARPSLPEPALGPRRGAYHAGLFFSTEAEFAVPAARLRSRHRSTVEDDALCIETDGTAAALVFGPYVTLPRGRWRLSLRVALDPPPGTEAAAQRLGLRVTKGLGSESLGRGTVTPAADDAFSLEFDNPRDTGPIECVLHATAAPLPAGCRLRVSDLRLARLD
jgi:hypothetical protein